MDENLKEFELFRLLTEKGFDWTSDFKKYLNEFRDTFKFKLTSYCAIRNKPSDKWTLFFGKVLFLPAFLEKQGNDIEEDFKKKCKNKYNCASEQIIINIKFEETGNSEKIDEIFIDAMNEGTIKNEESFYLKPPVNESPEPIFKFYPDSTVIPYGDLYINGKSRNIWTDLGLRIKELLEKTPFGNEIELRKYLSLNEFFNFGNPEYVEYTDTSAIHIQFIPPIYFKDDAYSDYNGCPVKFNFVNELEKNKLAINYNFSSLPSLNNANKLEEYKIANNKIKMKKEPSGSFKIKHNLPDIDKDRKIYLNLEYNDKKIHNIKKDYSKDIVKMLWDFINIKTNNTLNALKDNTLNALKDNWKYILAILPLLGLFEFIYYIIKHNGPLPFSLLNTELFIVIPLLYAIMIVLICAFLFSFPLTISVFIYDTLSEPFNKIEEYIILIFSFIILILIPLLFEFIIIHFFLYNFFKIKNTTNLISSSILIGIFIIFIACSVFLLQKKLISITRYISISSLIMLGVLYIIFFLKFPGAPLRILKIGGDIPIKLCVSEKFINAANISFKKEYYKHNIKLCNANDYKNTMRIINNRKSQWINFLLFFKTPNAYYVNCGKSTPLLLIPSSYVYSEKFIT